MTPEEMVLESAAETMAELHRIAVDTAEMPLAEAALVQEARAVAAVLAHSAKLEEARRAYRVPVPPFLGRA